MNRLCVPAQVARETRTLDVKQITYLREQLSRVREMKSPTSSLSNKLL